MARARELLRAGEARGSGPDHRDALAGLRARRLGYDPTLAPAAVDDEVLDRLDADWIAVDVERAGLLAGRGADPSSELREVVRRVQHVERCAPLLPVDEVVPVGNDVVDGTARHAERDAAIHAPRALLRRLVVLECDDEFAVVAQPLGRRQRDFLDPLELHEARDLAHYAAALCWLDVAACAGCSFA